MGQHSSTQRVQRGSDNDNAPLFSRWNEDSQRTAYATPNLDRPAQNPPPVSMTIPPRRPSHPPTPSARSFATFSRHISAASTPAPRGGSAERGPTVGRRDAIFYEQQEERPLVHMDELGMRNAPITYITASPMPRRSRLSRLSSIFSSRQIGSGRAHSHPDEQLFAQGSLHRDSLEIAREGQRRRSRRSSYYGAASPETLEDNGDGGRRGNASTSGPIPLRGNSTVPSSLLGVSSHTDAIRQRELHMSIEGTDQPTGFSDPAISPFARFRRSVSSSLEAHPPIRRSWTHDHATQTPQRQPIRSFLPNNDFPQLSSPIVADPAANFTAVSGLDPSTGQESSRTSPPNLRENIEGSPLRRRGSVWSDRWSDRPPVGRRESRRVPSMPGGRSTRLLRRDHDGPLPRMLSLAAFAIAAQLAGSTEPAASDLQAIGPDDLDGNLRSLFRALQTTPHHATRDSDTEERASPMGRLAGPASPLNYLRVFRFVSDANTTEAHPDSLTQERSAESDHATASPATTETRSENLEGRTVTLVVVGVRSVASDEAAREAHPGVEHGLDSLLEFPPLTPASTFLSGGAGGLLRNVNGTPRFAHRRRASSGGISTFPANYDSQRHQSTLSINRPSSVHATPVSGYVTPSGVPGVSFSDSPAGPHPPPSTPAEPGLSTYSSQTTTPSRRPSSASATQQLQTSFQEPATFQARGASPITEGQEQPVRRVQHRRRSDAEFARHRDLGAGAARRNGVVAPDDDDAAAPTATGSRSWLIYVVGTNLTQDHPALTAPSLFTDSPSYEDMLLLSSLLGPAKPPVADSEDVAAAGGVFCIGEGPGSLAARSTQGNNLLHIATGERCLVCLEEYQPLEQLRQLNKCCHIFHRECIDEWLTTGRNSCPLCRGEGVPDKRENRQSQDT